MRWIQGKEFGVSQPEILRVNPDSRISDRRSRKYSSQNPLKPSTVAMNANTLYMTMR
jgi:hypothetical protein